MKIIPTSVRLKPELYDKIKADAEKEQRSISSQIAYMITKYYEMRELATR